MVCTGKSAGMIMRQINADALAEAKALHLEQTCDLLQACHLSSDAIVMDQKPAQSSGSPVPRHLGVRQDTHNLVHDTLSPNMHA